MNIILLEKINNLGMLGDQVNVKSGYGRNYLIPQGKALPATAANLEKFEVRRAELEKAEAVSIASANERVAQLEGKQFVIVRKSGDEGKMFGSVTNGDIAEVITTAGIDVAKREVRLPEGAIRELGEYTIAIHVHTDINVDVTILVEAE